MLDTKKIKDLQKFAAEIRIETLQALAEFGVGHIGGSLSLAEVLAVLYGEHMNFDAAAPQWEDRDYFVLSKGHCGPALYATLAIKGFYPKSWLKTINRPYTNLPSHCDRNRTPGIDMTTGSLGQGASSAAGIATGLKVQGKKNYVYLILGDGECQEGQVWEMALYASQQRLSNFIAFVDNNKIQLDGFTDDINSMGDIRGKFAEFGWYSQEVDGHDVAAIDAAITKAKSEARDKPSMIVLNTVKGKGWEAIENTAKSHSLSFTIQDVEPVIERLRSMVIEEEVGV